MSNISPNVVPKTNVQRPQLPFAHANPFLAMTDNTKLPNVKYQVITREGQEIVVGRVKIQTPGGGHAFVLRRFDTGAVSLTTMFRAAFPSAPEEAEKTESSWVKANFDSYGANGGIGKDVLRLAGTWVRPDVAATIAPLYSLDYVISPLVNAAPDPRQEYRRSTKPASPQANGSSSPSKATNPRIEVDSPPSPSPAAGPAPTKRRKESSPVVTSPSKASSETLPVPRRSGRTASPTPISAFSQTTTTVSASTRTTRVKTSKARASIKPTSAGKPSNRLTPVESDHAHNDDDGDDDVAEVPGPNMHEDVAEQRELIAKLKAERAERQERAAAEAAANAAEISAVPIQQSDSQSSKRSREEEDQPLKFKFRNPDAQNTVANRQIKSNKRLSLDLEPQQKSAAWGALWFAAGLAAAATIPSFFM